MVDTERLLKIVQEYSEHEYAPYAGGASLLAGAAVWFYATDITRVLKVSLVNTGEPTFVLTFVSSILPIVSVSNKGQGGRPYPVHWKTPGYYDSSMGMCPDPTTP